jgi:hypothetical protein|eukprot:scaffold390_cov191-Alexandrium_tamarense.AAC.9
MIAINDGRDGKVEGVMPDPLFTLLTSYPPLRMFVILTGCTTSKATGAETKPSSPQSTGTATPQAPVQTKGAAKKGTTTSKKEADATVSLAGSSFLLLDS